MDSGYFYECIQFRYKFTRCYVVFRLTGNGKISHGGLKLLKSILTKIVWFERKHRVEQIIFFFSFFRIQYWEDFGNILRPTLFLKWNNIYLLIHQSKRLSYCRKVSTLIYQIWCVFPCPSYVEFNKSKLKHLLWWHEWHEWYLFIGNAEIDRSIYWKMFH